MNNLLILIPVALFLGAVGLVAFLWALRSGQYDDMDGAAARVLLDEDRPGKPGRTKSGHQRALRDQPDRRD